MLFFDPQERFQSRWATAWPGSPFDCLKFLVGNFEDFLEHTHIAGL
jgi:hypothetical protein